mmetsp:Transcript_61907/g.171562  ORF Transcript_61907/g.171562 Transcript_61907/m.171562 type:complete len:646 (+) Transcript_61907:56-1993(+)
MAHRFHVIFALVSAAGGTVTDKDRCPIDIKSPVMAGPLLQTARTHGEDAPSWVQDEDTAAKHAGEDGAEEEQGPDGAAVGLVHVLARAGGRGEQRPNVPEIQPVAESSSECREVLAVLTHHKMTEIRQVWQSVCSDDDKRARLKELANGCLYLPSDKQMEIFWSVLERPNFWHFVKMFEDSFFQDCPGARPGVNATAVGGAAVMSCEAGADHGLLGRHGACHPATLLGSTATSGVRVYKIDALMGLDFSWRVKLLSAGDQSIVREASLAERARKRPSSRRAAEHANLQVTIPLEYYVCDPGDGSIDSMVTDKMLTDQTAVLNQGFSGANQCLGPLAYQPAYANARIQFSDYGIVRISNEVKCGYECTDNIRYLTRNVVPREDGRIKVLICETESLGLASFPGEDDSWRILLMQPGVLPGAPTLDYNLGDTLVHEMGHYLGLYHTFEGGCGRVGDGIADTPKEKRPHYGCPTGNRWRKSCRSGDPVHNFMDYSDDKCLCSFSDGQVSDMWSDMEQHMQDIFRLAVPIGSQPAPAPAPAPQPTMAPAPTSTPACVVDTIQVKVTRYPDEVSWSLAPKDDPSMPVCSGGPYSAKNRVFQEECCLLPGTRYRLRCSDSWGDGWEGGFVKINDVTYCKGRWRTKRHWIEL